MGVAGQANQNLQDKNRVKTVGAVALTQQGATPGQGAAVNPFSSSQTGDFSDGVTMWTQDPNGNLCARVLARGVIPSSRAAFSVNPSNNDQVVIGATTVQFKTVLGAAGANAQVFIGASAAATLANLVAYINGTFTAAQAVESTTPPTFLAVADAVTATSLRLRYALTRGGAAAAAVSPSLALTISVTGGASTWSSANLNETGKAASDVYESYGKTTVTAADITNGTKWIELPFTPSTFSVDCYSSGGVKRAYSDVTAINGNAIQITLGGGASPNIQANDVLSFWASA